MSLLRVTALRGFDVQDAIQERSAGTPLASTCKGGPSIILFFSLMHYFISLFSYD